MYSTMYIEHVRCVWCVVYITFFFIAVLLVVYYYVLHIQSLLLMHILYYITTSILVWFITMYTYMFTELILHLHDVN